MANKQFTVLLDMDSTVYDLWTPTFAYIGMKTGRYFTPKALETWHWCEDNGLNPFEYWEKEGSFLNLRPFPGAVEAIKEIYELGIKQVFFTKIVTKYAAWEKLETVDRDFPFIGRKSVLITGGDKGLAKGDVLVDDGPGFLEEFKKTTGGLIVLANMHSAPYCKYPQADEEMTDWKQYPSIILDLMNNHQGWEENVG